MFSRRQFLWALRRIGLILLVGVLSEVVFVLDSRDTNGLLVKDMPNKGKVWDGDYLG